MTPLKNWQIRRKNPLRFFTSKRMLSLVIGPQKSYNVYNNATADLHWVTPPVQTKEEHYGTF